MWPAELKISKLYRGSSKKGKKKERKTKAEEGSSSSHDSKQWSQEDTETLMKLTQEMMKKLFVMKKNENKLILTFQTFVKEVYEALKQNKTKYNVDEQLTRKEKNEFKQKIEYMQKMLKEYWTEHALNDKFLSSITTKYEGHPILGRKPYVGVTTFEKELQTAKDSIMDFENKFKERQQTLKKFVEFEKPVFDFSELIKSAQKLNVNDTPKATKDTIDRQEQDKLLDIEKSQQEEKRRKELREAHK